MATIRPRRIVRRTVIGLLFSLACVLAFLEWRGFHEIDPWLVGRWVYVYDGQRTNVVYEFNSDGTGATFVQPGLPDYEFDWSVS